jgi:predicted permease
MDQVLVQLLNAGPIVLKVLIVFALMCAGALARHVGWLTAEADKSLMRLTINVLLPCLFFYRVVGDPRMTGAAEIGLPPLIGFLTTSLGFLVAAIALVVFGRFIGIDRPEQKRAFTLSAGMYNYGYIPLPIAEKLFPAAVGTLIVHNVGVELALWTLGMLIISGGLGKGTWRGIFNPPAVAITLAVVIGMFARSSMLPPDLKSNVAVIGNPILDAARWLGDCGIPMGLLLSGAVIRDLITETDWKRGWGMFALACGVRLLLLPVLFLILAKLLPVSIELKQVIVIQAAMPAAVFPIVVTRLYGQDTQVALRIIVGTTILGLITIPLWLIVGRAWIGV